MKQPVPFGKYTLLERISVGGMAEVFRAKAFGAEGFERLVAVKRILPNIAEDQEFIRMFVDEAKLALQLHHANIAQIADWGVVHGAYYIALEHVHGRDVRSLFERIRPSGQGMPVSHACFIAMKVCEGLDYAHNKRDQAGHEMGLVHRDVSPQNVLVSFEGEVKIIDFGIAKAAGQGSKTQSGILKGKFGYMSPEQVRGLPVDRRSDVFSCGIVLYEMLTGERLFLGESDFSTLEKVRNVEIVPPTAYNPALPAELERIVLRALAKDVTERYQHAIDLHDELQAFVYTAGEFCSRKDLSTWMKKTFSKELEDESAKLEGFRQLPTGLDDQERSSGLTSGVVTGVASAVSTGLAMRTGPRATANGVGAPGAAAIGSHVPVTTNGAARSARATATTAATGTPGQVSAAGIGTRSGADDGAGSSASSEGGNPRRTRAMGSQGLTGARPPPPPPAGRPSVVAASAGERARSDSSASSSAKLLLVSSDTSAEARAGSHLPGPPDSDELASWDEEEELETQIYDNDFEASPVPKGVVLRPLASSLPVARPLSPVAVAAASTRPAGAAPRTGALLSQSLRGADVAPGSNHAGSLPRSAAEPTVFPPTLDGRDPGRAAPSIALPRPPAPAFPIPAPPSRELAMAPVRNKATELAREFAIESRRGEIQEPSYGRTPTFGRGLLGGRSRSSRGPSLLATILGGAALVIGGVVLALTFGGGSSRSNVPPTIADDRTGFDLYVVPSGITRWRLDGELRTDRLPSRIRGIAPGVHAVVIEAPPGFMSQSQNVTVAVGQAQKVTIELPVMEITGTFVSEPQGATITLIVDGVRTRLGPSPASHPLDPRKSYQVLFEMPGYVSANRPVTLSGLERESITVVLEKADGSTPARALDPIPALVPARSDAAVPGGLKRPPLNKPAPDRPEPPKPRAPVKGVAAGEPNPGTPSKSQPAKDPSGEEPVISAEGTLQLGSKPPCEILVDGKATGLSTPQREILLPVGSHKITLVNEEYSIRESFFVDIRADVPAKVVKDFSDRLPAN
jgi:eukaryotic-like serine/threonine-protein kinase